MILALVGCAAPLGSEAVTWATLHDAWLWSFGAWSGSLNGTAVLEYGDGSGGSEVVDVNLAGGFLGAFASFDGSWLGEGEAFSPGEIAIDFTRARPDVVEDDLLDPFWGGHAGIAVGAGVGTSSLWNEAGLGLEFDETSLGVEVLAGLEWLRVAVPVDG